MVFYFISSEHGVESNTFTKVEDVTKEAYRLKTLNAYMDSTISVLSWEFDVRDPKVTTIRTVG